MFFIRGVISLTVEKMHMVSVTCKSNRKDNTFEKIVFLCLVDIGSLLKNRGYFYKKEKISQIVTFKTKTTNLYRIWRTYILFLAIFTW